MKKTKKTSRRKITNVQKRVQKRRRIQYYLRMGLVILVVLLIILLLIKLFKPDWLAGKKDEPEVEKFEAIEPEIVDGESLFKIG